jgi:hypothetical protein
VYHFQFSAPTLTLTALQFYAEIVHLESVGSLTPVGPSSTNDRIKDFFLLFLGSVIIPQMVNHGGLG